MKKINQDFKKKDSFYTKELIDKEFKTIIPGLVTFDTNLVKIKGFNLSENLNFYKNTHIKEKFHYKIVLDNNISIPDSYEFRNGYYFKKDDYWYYKREIFKGFSLKFKYDYKNKIFYFNSLYNKIPIEIGGIWPAGKHISDFINLDLFLKGYILLSGCAYQLKEKNICVIAPGFNGKTTLIKNIISKGGKYISEDLLIINFEKSKIFPTSPRTFNYFRVVNKKLTDSLGNSSIVKEEMNIDEIFLLQNTIKPDPNYKAHKKLINYLFTGSIFFLNNNFVRSYIAEENINKRIISIINKLNFKNIKFLSSIDWAIKNE